MFCSDRERSTVRRMDQEASHISVECVYYCPTFIAQGMHVGDGSLGRSPLPTRKKHNKFGRQECKHEPSCPSKEQPPEVIGHGRNIEVQHNPTAYSQGCDAAPDNVDGPALIRRIHPALHDSVVNPSIVVALCRSKVVGYISGMEIPSALHTGAQQRQ